MPHVAGRRTTWRLLDLCMPAMDGLELARLIKADQEISDVPLVLMTSGPDVRYDEADSAGLACALTKPVLMSRLMTTLAEAVGAGTESSPPGEEARQSRGRVLVVEDGEVNQIVAVGILSNLGFDVEVIDNGADAVEAVGTRLYDAVLMDVQMPGMDGLEATAD